MNELTLVQQAIADKIAELNGEAMSIHNAPPELLRELINNKGGNAETRMQAYDKLQELEANGDEPQTSHEMISAGLAQQGKQ